MYVCMFVCGILPSSLSLSILSPPTLIPFISMNV
jgi:hypothetical protein